MDVRRIAWCGLHARKQTSKQKKSKNFIHVTYKRIILPKHWHFAAVELKKNNSCWKRLNQLIYLKKIKKYLAHKIAKSYVL